MSRTIYIAPTPIYSVMLEDSEQWIVEAEWPDPATWSFIDQTCFSRSGGFGPNRFPLFQGVRLDVDRMEFWGYCMIMLLVTEDEKTCTPRPKASKSCLLSEGCSPPTDADPTGGVENDPRETSLLMPNREMARSFNLTPLAVKGALNERAAQHGDPPMGLQCGVGDDPL